MLFISSAYAQDAAASAQPDLIANIAPMLVIFGIVYFLMIRPQQQKFKSHQNMINAISRHDEVVTGGGIIGKVTKIEDNILHVEIAKGIEVRVNRSTIAEVLSLKSKAPEEKASKKPGKSKK